MSFINKNQGNNFNLSEVLNKSDKVFIVEFLKNGSIAGFSEKLPEKLGFIKDEFSKLSLQKLFDFRITDIIKNIDSLGEISAEINLVGKNRNFVYTKTVFTKGNNGVTAIIMPALEQFNTKELNSRFIKALHSCIEILSFKDLPEDSIFKFLLNQIKNLISYDKAIILLLEGNTLIAKTHAGFEFYPHNHKKTITEKDKILSYVLSTQKSILDNNNQFNSSIITEIGLGYDFEHSAVISPLKIRETVYGFIILIRDKQGLYDENDLVILETLSSVSSYMIKDAELSQVFAMQLKILKENILERTKTLELIKEQNKKILEADKIKNEFLANMSHELRTPLNAIIGFSEALGLKIFGDLNEKQAEYIRDINSSGVHLLGMINDLLDLSKIESGKMQLNKERFNVKFAINEALSIVSQLVEQKRINIKFDCKDSFMEIDADRRKFHQILYNLLSNAIKFTHEKGHIEVKVVKENKFIKISVKDDGIGIAPEYHEKIFGKFQQVNSAHSAKQGSTGLGLTITKELIKIHGGKIQVESKPNKGATFIFTLPT